MIKFDAKTKIKSEKLRKIAMQIYDEIRYRN